LSFRHFCGYLLPRGTSDSQCSLFFSTLLWLFSAQNATKGGSKLWEFFFPKVLLLTIGLKK
jgi:hypothetical protein